MSSAPQGFWSQRWSGEAPWRVLLWRDMLAVGSALNLATGFAALMLVSQDQPVAWALLVHFAPVPYNAFLLHALWRTTARPSWVMPAAWAWFASMLVV